VKDTKAMKSFSPANFHSISFRAHGSRRNFISIRLVFLFLLYSAYLPAQQTKAPESAVKATYLYNFSRFVQWPADAAAAKSGSFSICVLGEDPFGTVLDTILSGEAVGGKPVMTKRVMKAQDALNCHVLYISASEDSRLKEILAEVDKAGVLTVSDIPQFSQRGGMIQFIVVGNKLRFEVNLTNAQSAGLTLSSDLLKVAVAVRKSS
jgi:hypothetical protein